MRILTYKESLLVPLWLNVRERLRASEIEFIFNSIVPCIGIPRY